MNNKILTILLAVVALVFVVSCNKDKEELIVGKWQISTEDGVTNETAFNHYIPAPIEYMDNWGFVFHAGGSGFSYEVENGSESEREQLTYTIDGDDMYILYSNGVRIRWTVEKVGKKKLVLSERYELTDGNGDRRFGFGRWNFVRKEYTTPAFPTDTIVPVDTVPSLDTVAVPDTAKSSKFVL